MKTKGMEGSKVGEEDISKFKFDLGSKVRTGKSVPRESFFSELEVECAWLVALFSLLGTRGVSFCGNSLFSFSVGMKAKSQ